MTRITIYATLILFSKLSHQVLALQSLQQAQVTLHNPDFLQIREDTRAPRRNLHGYRETAQTSHRHILGVRVEPSSLKQRGSSSTCCTTVQPLSNANNAALVGWNNIQDLGCIYSRHQHWDDQTYLRQSFETLQCPSTDKWIKTISKHKFISCTMIRKMEF